MAIRTVPGFTWLVSVHVVQLAFRQLSVQIISVCVCVCVCVREREREREGREEGGSAGKSVGGCACERVCRLVLMERDRGGWRKSDSHH